ncbi:MAG: type II secretion system protein GspG [Sandaracinaceae bacterium]
MRSASVMYTSENAGQCPSIPDLIEGGYLDRSKRCVDAWDNAFLILCPGDDVIVVSAGPDERLGTEDDIQ